MQLTVILAVVALLSNVGWAGWWYVDSSRRQSHVERDLRLASEKIGACEARERDTLLVMQTERTEIERAQRQAQANAVQIVQGQLNDRIEQERQNAEAQRRAAIRARQDVDQTRQALIDLAAEFARERSDCAVSAGVARLLDAASRADRDRAADSAGVPGSTATDSASGPSARPATGSGATH